ncbi:MAG: hypothetical protein WCF99_09575 [Chloroflexales bacterium]
MLRTFRRVVAPLSVALLLSLAACGGRQAAAPTATPVPPTEAPTRTPRPTREPVATAEPTTEPTAVVLSNDAPTSSTSDSQLKSVDIGDLETYAHTSGVFEIGVPNNWTLQDNSKADELILVWTDPTRNGAMVVDIYEDAKINSTDNLAKTLQKYLKNTFGSEPDFSTGDPKTQTDKSVLIAWTYTATADNGTKAPLLGNTFIEQRGNKISLLSTLVPQDQFKDLKDKTNQIINSYKITPDAPIKP